ncbi:hypothetical protein PoB_000293100 [Plakobranchus ocellatus]|uniref:Uncharacterized protein n=1 Tax=Plakobranchus ocellatus TaxID=259542 RepID=A0AAV3Y016_9GAST|nr:hypothetical protein PoB_000293100 [Plakobranchus ocellatus]
MSGTDTGDVCESRAKTGVYLMRGTEAGFVCMSGTDTGDVCESRAKTGVYLMRGIEAGFVCMSGTDTGDVCESRAKTSVYLMRGTEIGMIGLSLVPLYKMAQTGVLEKVLDNLPVISDDPHIQDEEYDEKHGVDVAGIVDVQKTGWKEAANVFFGIPHRADLC